MKNIKSDFILFLFNEGFTFKKQDNLILISTEWSDINAIVETVENSANANLKFHDLPVTFSFSMIDTDDFISKYNNAFLKITGQPPERNYKFLVFIDDNPENILKISTGKNKAEAEDALIAELEEEYPDAKIALRCIGTE